MTVSIKFQLSVLCLLMCLLTFNPAQAAFDRVALVIGNGAYRAMSTLRNPPNDADLMSTKLSGLGFEVVRVIDGDKAAFAAALTEFGRKAQGADVALVFYAGHGVQVNGRNWLLPIDADIIASTDLPGQAIKANDLLEFMEISGARLKLVFFDACRNNPLPRSLTRGTSNGLARLEANAAGMMIAFATAPGDVALDGTGNNSPFTEALARLIDTPDLEVRHLMGKVRESVYVSTGERQLPWLNEALIGEFYFGGKSASGASPNRPQPQVAAVAPSAPRPSHRPAPRYISSQCVAAPVPGDTIEVCASSILNPQYGNRYGPGNLLDGKLSTAWVEGVSGNGPGERIVMSFKRPRQLAGFEIVNGYAKNRDIFRKNARVQTARLTLSNGDSQIISLPDTMATSSFSFAQPVETTWLELQIETVFSGSKYTDTALSELVPVFAD
ncbi:MAG: caspase family protein [Rhodobacteraceae bacterium]|nr:caspase family protein [Paracoccaceae bacterium]